MFKTILVPVDLADVAASRPALKQARALAAMTGARVSLVYVSSILPISYLEYVPRGAQHEEHKRYEAQIGQMADAMELPPDRVTSSVRAGSVYREVLDEAKSVEADLIVVGSHRPTMATYLLGSNAAAIVRHAPCSVLVVRDATSPAASMTG